MHTKINAKRAKVLTKSNKNCENDEAENSKQPITTPHKMSKSLNPKYKTQTFKNQTSKEQR